jgi:voltage-gated potassium channel
VREQDRGSANGSAIRATDDVLSCCSVRSGNRGFVSQQPPSFLKPVKTLASELAYFVRGHHAKRNLKAFLLYLLFLVVVVVIYAFLFCYFMWRFEGRDYSIVAGFYWTITAMTTLGFGDITFATDYGQIFSTIVTLSGVLFILVILPFSAVSLFLGPWMEERLRYRPRLGLPDDTHGHVIMCGWDPVTRLVAENLRVAGETYVLVESDYDKSARLDEEGVHVVYGIPTDREVLERVRLGQARAVVANLSDTDNANLLLTAKLLARTPVLAMVTEAERVDLMRAAGADETVALREVLGGYLAVRATTKGSVSHIVDSLGELVFAEVPAHGTPFVGLTLAEAAIREKTGASVIGIWERGRFSLPQQGSRIPGEAVLMLAGARSSLDALEKMTGDEPGEDLVLVIGYGTVGRAAAGYLERNDVPHILVDKDVEELGLVSISAPSTPANADSSGIGAGTTHPVLRRVLKGDASRQAVLEEAGIREARGVIITTNDDGTNVFLTLACRKLNPHIRIVARANREENVDEIYAAGADFVVSGSSVGASILTNAIEGRKTIFLTEGVHIFWRSVPVSLDGTTLAQSNIRAMTGATVIAVQKGLQNPELSIGPDTVLHKEQTLLMVGSPASESAFLQRFRDD